jgi:hypothetical protein
MATITLDYNARNSQARKALEYILSLGYFKPKEFTVYQPVANSKSKDDYEFEKLFGTWESNLSAEEQVAELRAARSQIFNPRVYP